MRDRAMKQTQMWIARCIVGALFGSWTFASTAEETHRPGFAAQAVIEAEQLGQLRAGNFDKNTTVQSIQDLTAVVTDTSIAAGIMDSGAITFHENAFSGFSGIGNFLNNTGNGNAINAAVGVTFHLE